MYINKKIILGTILILALTYFGTTYNNMVAKLWIGSVTITDSLTGFAKFNHGVYTDSSIYSKAGGIYSGGQIQSPAGFGFTTPTTVYIDDDGSDISLGFPVGSRAYFLSGSKTVAQIDSSKGVMSNTFLTLPLITNSDVADSTANEFKMFIKGDKLVFFFMDGTVKHYFYADLTAKGNIAEWIYSATCP